MSRPNYKPHALSSIPPETPSLQTPTSADDSLAHLSSLAPLPLHQELAQQGEIEATLRRIRAALWADGAVWRSIRGNTPADVFIEALRPILTLHLETGRHAAEILIARAAAMGQGITPQQAQRLRETLCIDHCQDFVAGTMPKIYDGKAAILDSLR